MRPGGHSALAGAALSAPEILGGSRIRRRRCHVDPQGASPASKASPAATIRVKAGGILCGRRVE